MEAKAECVSIENDLATGKTRLVLLTDRIGGEAITGKPLRLKLTEWKEKRSLDANAYFHLLCGKIAEKIGVSNAKCKNFLLRRYGEFEAVDGQIVSVVLPDTEEALRKAEEAETFHLSPTSMTEWGADGVMRRTWYLIRGSHTYNTAEMARLIDGTISDAKDLEIETMTPDEQARLIAAWERNHDGKKDDYSVSAG